MKKVKIVYTIPNFDTCGSGIALIKLIQGLDKSRFDPVIVCLHDKGVLFRKVMELSVPVYIFPYLTPLKPRFMFIYNVLEVVSFFKKLKPDIVFSYHYGSDYSEAVAARLAGARFIYVKKNMGWYGPSYNQWRIKTALSHAVTVQNSDMMKDFFASNTRASIISIGVDTEEFKPGIPNNNLLFELGIDDNTPVVLCVANIIPKKGIDFLLQGFKKSNASEKSMLIIVGDNQSELGGQLINLSAQLGLEDRVIFTGKRQDVKDFFSVANLFILPSTGNEGAPIAIQEAMASGVVVVTTDTPGNRDQLRELPDQLIPPMDAGAIANAIDRFLNLSNEEKLRILAIQSNIIEERYSLSEEIRKHEALYTKLMTS